MYGNGRQVSFRNKNGEAISKSGGDRTRVEDSFSLGIRRNLLNSNYLYCLERIREVINFTRKAID